MGSDLRDILTVENPMCFYSSVKTEFIGVEVKLRKIAEWHYWDGNVYLGVWVCVIWQQWYSSITSWRVCLCVCPCPLAWLFLWKMIWVVHCMYLISCLVRVCFVLQPTVKCFVSLTLKPLSTLVVATVSRPYHTIHAYWSLISPSPATMATPFCQLIVFVYN